MPSLSPPPAEIFQDILVKSYVKRMGWAPVGMPPDPVMVQKVDGLSWAEREGIRVKDELVRIDGQPVAGMGSAKFLQAIKDRPILLSFLRQVGTRSLVGANLT